MRRSILFLVQTAVLVAASVWIATRPGRIDIQWLDWYIETSVGFAVVAAIFVVIALMAIFNILPFIRRLLGRGRERSANRRRRVAYDALVDGMTAIAAGDAGLAEKKVRRLAKNIDDQSFVHLLTAQAAQLRGDDSAARDHFATLADGEATRFLGQRGLIVSAMRDGDLEAALALAQEGYRSHPRAPWLHNILAELYARLGRWEDAQRVLEEAIKRKLMPAAVANRQLAAMLLAGIAPAEQSGELGHARALAKRAHAADPQSAGVVIELARLEMGAGHRRRVRKLIEDAWTQTPHRSLAASYMEAVGAAEPLARFQALDTLHGLNPGARESAILLTEAAIDAKLWGNAYTQIDRLTEDGETARTIALKARIAAEDPASQGSHNQAKAASWLDRAVAAPDDAGWRCGRCGARSDAWLPLCHSCHSLGQIDWSQPPRADGADSEAALIEAEPASDTVIAIADGTNDTRQLSDDRPADGQGSPDGQAAKPETASQQ